MKKSAPTMFVRTQNNQKMMFVRTQNNQKMNLYERNQKDGLFDRKNIQKICKFAACVVPLHFDSPLPNRTWRGREK